MEDIKASEYFDRPCGSYEEFERIKAELEAQGFKDVGNSSTSSRLYWSHINMEREHFESLESARKKYNFRNRVEEKTWNLNNSGFQVLRTQGFTTDRRPLEDLVAFFVKPQTQSQ